MASQPTLSRFWNRMDKDTLAQFEGIASKMRETIYSIKHPGQMLFDLDTTLLATYGHQEGEGFNYHYQAHGYHPLLCFDGLTRRDLLKVELRDGTQYCGRGSGEFMTPLFQEYRSKYPEIPQGIFRYTGKHPGTQTVSAMNCFKHLDSLMWNPVDNCRISAPFFRNFFLIGGETRLF